MSAKRIEQIDGLRAIAALGVLWIHTWAAFNNPEHIIAGVNIAKLWAIGGNGVDFFFVISGFCMFYFYASKESSISSYKSFIIRRYYRIAPAFYLCALFTIAIHSFLDGSNGWVQRLAANFIFIQNFSDQFEIAGHFWSLAVEIHFYFLLPPFILGCKKYGFLNIYFPFICFFLILGIILLQFDIENRNLWNYQLFIRFPQFSCGLLAAYLLLNYTCFHDNIKKSLKHIGAPILGIIIMFSSRFLLTEGVLGSYKALYGLLKMCGFFGMTFGFMLILINVLIKKSFFSEILAHRFLNFIGKISYSFYL